MQVTKNGHPQMISAIRKPSAAGRFFPGKEKALKDLISQMLREEKPVIQSLNNLEIMGGIVPHAGYIYSGKTALHFFEALAQQKFTFDTAIILSPNHTGWGPGVALDEHDAWETPLGIVEIDKDLSNLLDLESSSEAHEIEHSAEVMLPMLQYFFKQGLKILPISLWDQSPLVARSLGLQLVAAKKKLGKKILVIASTDFSHYVSPEFGIEQDDMALDRIAQFDISGLSRVIHQNDISICGYGPVMTLLAMAKLIYQKPAFKILSRSHSGNTIKSEEVVHYVSGVVFNAAQ